MKEHIRDLIAGLKDVPEAALLVREYLQTRIRVGSLRRRRAQSA